MKKFVCIYITLGIIIFMTGCEAKQKSEMVNTPNPSDEQVGSVHLQNYTGVIVGVENAKHDVVDKISATDRLQIQLLDSDEIIVCELLGADTKYPNADTLKIGDCVDLECEVSVVDGSILSRCVLSIKAVQGEE